MEEIKDGKATEGLTINLNGKTLDMKGASMNMADADGGKVTKEFTVEGGSLKNVAVIDAANAGTGAEGSDGMYNAGGIFGAVTGGQVTIKDIVVENVHIKNTDVSGAAILVAQTSSGSIVIDNVTIKNSTVIAHRNAGALVGNLSDDGKVTLKNTIKLENVHVKTVGGRSGLLLGYVKDSNLIKDASLKIELTNCSYSIYECEQNTGTFESQKLGYDKATNILWSYAYNNSQKKDMLESKRFFEGAYATEKVADNGTNGAQDKYIGLDSYVTVK